MHYTGMYALTITSDEVARPVEGLSQISFLVPITIFVVVVIVVLFAALLHRPGGTEISPLATFTDRPGPQPGSGRFNGFADTNGAGMPTLSSRLPTSERRR
jgi:hypothetical protein